MNKDIAHCKNANCTEYKNNNCKRAAAHKEAISERKTMVAYITNRNNETACELFLSKG